MTTLVLSVRIYLSFIGKKQTIVCGKKIRRYESENRKTIADTACTVGIVSTTTWNILKKLTRIYLFQYVLTQNLVTLKVLCSFLPKS